MRGLRLLAGGALAAAVIGFEPAGAQPADTEARGGIQVTMHTHSSGTLRFPVERLAFDFAEGDEFAYSSRLCSGSAPFNDLALDFAPDYPGVDDDADGTAPVRHQIAGSITEVNGETGRIEGTITTVLCEPGPNGTQVESTGDMIVTHFEARFRLVSDNDLEIMGMFEISPEESTGVFEDLEGHGSIQGVFTCLAHERDPSQPTCADIGEFTDFVGHRGDPSKGPGEIQPGLRGTYFDPTVPTAA
jgi:hypothetical protein